MHEMKIFNKELEKHLLYDESLVVSYGGLCFIFSIVGNYVIATIIGLAGLYIIGYILITLIIAVFVYGHKTKNKYLSNKFTNDWMSAFDVAKNEWKTLKSYYKKPSNKSDSSQN